jgi:UPF0755 protein
MNNLNSFPRKKSAKGKVVFGILSFLLILVVACAGGALWYYNQLLAPADPHGKTVAFVISPGEATASVLSRLESEGFIRSATAVKVYLKQTGKQIHIEAGDFKLSPKMTIDEILKTLELGAIDMWVRLQEGWRVEQMAQELSNELGVEQADFISQAKESEGYLFPDSYLVNPEVSIPDLISILKNTFNKKYTAELQAKIEAQGLTPEEGVILASIVEREARSKKVRTEVAGVLLHRLNIEMALETDATVQYSKDSRTLASGKTPDKFWQPITQEEYRSVVSPYNTYLNAGLPPGPICNPSLSSLEAVAEADATTPYLYYIHDEQGNTHYAETFEEHQQNINNHL